MGDQWVTRGRSITEQPTIDGMTQVPSTILEPTAVTAHRTILLMLGAAAAAGILVASRVLLRLSSRASSDDEPSSPVRRDTRLFLSIFSDE